MDRFDRRELLRFGAGLTLAGLSPLDVLAQPPKEDPFTLGVAAGDPAPDGFVIWTRLATRPLEYGGGLPMRAIPVRWEVSGDEGFRHIVQSGETLARPELGHSVHVELTGLRPAARYWYRFHVGEASSRVGRARTAPAPGASPGRVRIGVAGCQNYEQGLYTAYSHLAAEEELDAVFHYGDYIYESRAGVACLPIGGDKTCFRRHAGDEIYSLDDYRRRYAQYKTDPDLQAAHAVAAFIPSFDDHEVDNNWAGQADQDGTPLETFALRRAVALQAWYENMPVRRAQFPVQGAVQAHRRIEYGDLLRIHVLDTRQHRSGLICGGGKPGAPCEQIGAPGTMLGADQETWLAEGLAQPTRWNLLAQQVMVMPFLYPASRQSGRANEDSWSGRPQARQRLVRNIQNHALTNVVIATGDVHKHHAGVLPGREGALDSPPIATEFVCTSISSGGDGYDMAPGWETVAADNPQCKLSNGRRGYQVFDIRPGAWTTDLRVVDKVSAPGGRLSTLARFTVEPGRPGLLI